MRRALVAIAALLLVPAVNAEKADLGKPWEIEASRMSADDARRMTIFEGNVVVTRGTMRLMADRLVVRQDAEGFQFATATGKPARFRQRQDPRPPEKEGVWMDGEALRVEIDEKANTVKLFENARVNRGGDQVLGNYILVDQNSEYFSVNAGQGADQRVKMTIQPKSAPKK